MALTAGLAVRVVPRGHAVIVRGAVVRQPGHVATAVRLAVYGVCGFCADDQPERGRRAREDASRCVLRPARSLFFYSFFFLIQKFYPSPTRIYSAPHALCVARPVHNLPVFPRGAPNRRLNDRYVRLQTRVSCHNRYRFHAPRGESEEREKKKYMYRYCIVQVYYGTKVQLVLFIYGC